MWESVIGDTQRYHARPKCPPQKPNHWFRSLVDTLRRYKTELFGAGDSEVRKQRMLDYMVKPTRDFVLAKYRDGLYRPACICGRSKKKQLFIASFYHTKKCLYVTPNDVAFDHGNLLNLKVSFMKQGKHMKGMVYGNNSPANKGFPSMFYVKKKDKWYKVPVRMIFLTRKQFGKLKFECITSDPHESDGNSMMEISCDTIEEQLKDLKEMDGDFEMS